MREPNEASTSTGIPTTFPRNRAVVAVDLVGAVKGLHELSPMQLNKLIRDSGNNFIRHISEDGSLIQVDLEKFARFLPLHLIAVIMSWERDKATFKYLLCGILLLHSMCDLAARMPKIEQSKILLDDVRVSEQLIDLVIYLLVLLGEYGQENEKTRNDMVLLHSALVACSLKLLTVIVSPQYQEVAQVLIAYSKVDVFADAALSAVCTDVAFLQSKLSTELQASSANSSPTAEETLNHLCQQCDSSLLFLQSLFEQKLFRECIVANKDLCHRGGVLALVHAVLELKIPSFHSMSSSYMASISGLKSKALSILLHLCEAESVSYLDEIASIPGCQNLAKLIAFQVLELLKSMFGVGSKLLNSSSGVLHPRGQLELNALRLADVFSDDSNFRSFITGNFTETLAAVFLLPHGDFLSNWCSSDFPLCGDDASLDVPQGSYAHQRTSLLIKVIANLHCFVPDVCQDEKDLFLNKFVHFTQNEKKRPSVRWPSAFIAEKTALSKNICLLLSHAESLVPRFLNEDDMQLLRLFVSQFDARAASQDSQIHDDTSVLGVQSTPLHGGVAPIQSSNDVKNIEVKLETANLPNIDRPDVIQDVNCQSFSDEMILGRIEQGKSDEATVNMNELDRDAQTNESSGSDSSPMRGYNTGDQMDEHIRGSGYEETVDDEKVDTTLSDEKQQRKRKRAVMNDKQIALIEAALLEEPDMHRNSALLQSWADKLSLHGAEVTTSRLKNWLNNRKAKLARAAKDVRALYEVDNLDKQGVHGGLDSIKSSVNDGSHVVIVDENKDAAAHLFPSPPAVEMVGSSEQYLMPDQYVMLFDGKKDVIGTGKVFQVKGDWCGMQVEQCGMCVVDITELRTDKHSKLPHPMEVTGETFDETEKKLGLMRVLWSTNNLLKLGML